MSGMGKERLVWELEKFVVTRLRPCGGFPFIPEINDAPEVRLQAMDAWWEQYKSRDRIRFGELVNSSRLTNHEICHNMFWNAFRARSKMYIQIENLLRVKDAEDEFYCRLDGEEQVTTLQCSLLTLQMLDYDMIMFRAMNDPEDEEYRKAAQNFYRPYLFSYIMELDKKRYQKLRTLQEKAKTYLSQEEYEEFPYLWFECTFDPGVDAYNIRFDGYVVQSASSINKIRTELYIRIEDPTTSRKMAKNILDTYNLRLSCLKDDKYFIEKMEQQLKYERLSTIDVYRIGNGNCIYAQNKSGDLSFFYDIGFHYRHRPQTITPGSTYSYVGAMKKIYAQKPCIFILSHWDMDHIAGSAAAKKNFLDQDWFAPDCWDACIDAQRLAKYLDLKDHLFLARRPKSVRPLPSGRCIGTIDVKDTATPSQIAATYRFYMGKKASCDSSFPNCEGIVIEYTDYTKKQKTVLMMGDVNYASFNEARRANHDLLFADTRIDYLIAPHHGSRHTDYEKITAGKTPITGQKAIICCTNNSENKEQDRPDDEHKKELIKRFNKNVCTTQEALPKDQYIRINL